jgi:hypothetical protein
MATNPKVTDWTKDKYNYTRLRGWVRRGLTNDQLAKEMHITRSTFYKWKAENADFSDILKEDREYCDDTIENALYEAAKEGNIAAIKFYLTNRRRKEWKDRQDVELSGEVGIADAMIQESLKRRERLENES